MKRYALLAWRVAHALIHFVVSVGAIGMRRLEEKTRPWPSRKGRGL